MNQDPRQSASAARRRWIYLALAALLVLSLGVRFWVKHRQQEHATNVMALNEVGSHKWQAIQDELERFWRENEQLEGPQGRRARKAYASDPEGRAQWERTFAEKRRQRFEAYDAEFRNAYPSLERIPVDQAENWGFHGWGNEALIYRYRGEGIDSFFGICAGMMGGGRTGGERSLFLAGYKVILEVFGYLGYVSAVLWIATPLMCASARSKRRLLAGVLVFLAVAFLSYAVMAEENPRTLLLDRENILISVTALVITAAVFTWARLTSRQRLPYLCNHCDYNLLGNVSGICPECGTAIPAGQQALLVPADAEFEHEQ